MQRRVVKNEDRIWHSLSILEISPRLKGIFLQSVRVDVLHGATTDSDADAFNERQEWALEQIDAGAKLRSSAVVRHFSCALRTAKRDLAELSKMGLIEFTGGTRSGWYRAKRSES